MKKYITNPSTCQALPPLLWSIYTEVVKNLNIKAKKQEPLTRKYIKTLVYQGYTLDSISNALNALADLGLLVFNKVTQAWDIMIALLVCQNEANYDYYIKYKQGVTQGEIMGNQINWGKYKKTGTVRINEEGSIGESMKGIRRANLEARNKPAFAASDRSLDDIMPAAKDYKDLDYKNLAQYSAQEIQNKINKLLQVSANWEPQKKQWWFKTRILALEYELRYRA